MSVIADNFHAELYLSPSRTVTHALNSALFNCTGKPTYCFRGL